MKIHLLKKYLFIINPKKKKLPRKQVDISFCLNITNEVNNYFHLIQEKQPIIQIVNH